VDIKISNNEGGERKMKNRKEALCGVVLALGVVIGMFGGCLGGDKTQDRAESKIQERAAQERELEWFVNEEVGYRIKYPAGWKIDDRVLPEHLHVSSRGDSPYGVGSGDHWTTNSLDIIEWTKKNLKGEFESYLSNIKENAILYDEEVIIEETKELSVNGMPAMEVTYKYLDPEGPYVGRDREFMIDCGDFLLFFGASQTLHRNDPEEVTQGYIKRWDRLIDEEILPSLEIIR
jgi:hypothetical protein